MIQLPVIRWGEPYESMEKDTLVHFATGEPVAEIGRANGAMAKRDMRKAGRARDALRQVPIQELIGVCKKAADLFLNAELPLGNGTQSPEQFVRQQSATSGLPETLARSNMQKNHFVLSRMDEILTALTRGLDLNVLTRGYGEERGIPISYQCLSPVVGLVLPSNSPGVHTLWLPIIPLQVGLVLKPGSQEPWTPYRMHAALTQAGVPKEAISLYPGGHDVGGEILSSCARSLIFGGAQTVEQYKSNPGVQVHGPGWSKILLGDDSADRWEEYLDLMVESVASNGGRSCINASQIFTPRHGRAIADALAERLAKIEPLPPDDPKAQLAAFTVSGTAEAINNSIDADAQLPGVTDVTAKVRPSGRWVAKGRYDYLLPTVLHATSPDSPAAKKEFMFPFVTVVDCPEDRFVEAIGPTLVCTAITEKAQTRQALLDAPHVDRLNVGPIPTNKLNWLQPHEGNIVEFLYRARAFQSA